MIVFLLVLRLLFKVVVPMFLFLALLVSKRAFYVKNKALTLIVFANLVGNDISRSRDDVLRAAVFGFSLKNVRILF